MLFTVGFLIFIKQAIWRGGIPFWKNSTICLRLLFDVNLTFFSRFKGAILVEDMLFVRRIDLQNNFVLWHLLSILLSQ